MTYHEKVCRVCKQVFTPDSGYQFVCCGCQKEYRRKCSKEWAIKNPERVLQTQRKRYARCKDNIMAYRKRWTQENIERIKKLNHLWYVKNIDRCREYNEKNKDKIRILKREYERGRRKKLEYRITQSLRTLFGNALKRYGNGKMLKTCKYGVDYRKIIDYIGERPNDGRKYHIDHIRPLCSFDLTKMDEIKKAFAPENHQWLEASENLRKGGKYEI